MAGGAFIDVRFENEDQDLLSELSRDLDIGYHDVALNALSLYKTLLDWKAKGNHIDMVTPARGEIRDELQLP